MDTDTKSELKSFLEVIPSVEFCCVYGSSLHPNSHDKSKMVDFILGVSNPLEWHSENLKSNRDHYTSWMAHLGGARLITGVAERIGVGIHFNPYIKWSNKMLKYGVVGMDDLVQDVVYWERFYLAGRLQKPVEILVDNVDLEDSNSANLRAALSGALLLLPTKFSEEDLYAKVSSLSYTGDVRMLFAEDRSKVRKIVEGQFDLFKSKYKPFIQEYETKELLRSTPTLNYQANISQDCSLSATRALVSFLPPTVRSQMAMKLGATTQLTKSGAPMCEVSIRCREEAANCMEKILKRKVMASSARQAISGLLAVGGVNGVRYLARKVQKAWKSWI